MSRQIKVNTVRTHVARLAKVTWPESVNVYLGSGTTEPVGAATLRGKFYNYDLPEELEDRAKRKHHQVYGTFEALPSEDATPRMTLKALHLHFER